MQHAVWNYKTKNWNKVASVKAGKKRIEAQIKLKRGWTAEWKEHVFRAGQAPSYRKVGDVTHTYHVYNSKGVQVNASSVITVR